MGEEKFYVCKAREEDWNDAIELAFRTFMKYESEQYGPEGIKMFSDFLTDEMLKRMFLLGEYRMFVAKDETGKIVGIISLRSGNHISLLFVESEYHRKGIATLLMKHVCHILQQEDTFKKVTVNAAPYGIPFYHHYGFLDMGPMTKRDGIIYVPMECDIRVK